MVDIATISKYQVSNGSIPSSGIVFGFSQLLVLNAPITIDLKPLVNLNRIVNVQGVYLDNSAGTAPLTFSGSANQNISIPAGCQGLMPLYLSADMVINFSGVGNVNVLLLNFPTPAAVWNATNAATLPIVGGLMQVQDVALDALIANGALAVNSTLLGDSDLSYHQHSGKAFNGSLSTAVLTNIIAGGVSAFVNGFSLNLSPNASMTAATTITVTLSFTSAGTIFSRKVYVPAAATNAPIKLIDISGLNLIGNLAGDNVALQLSSALTAGALEYTIYGGKTSIQ